MMMTSADFLDLVRAGDLDGVEEALRRDADLSRSKDESGVSAIMIATYLGRGEVAQRLGERRDDLSIFEATVLRRLDRLQEIVGAIPDAVHAVSSDGYTALGFAAYFGAIEEANFLLEADSNPNFAAKNALGTTPLHSALAGGRRAIALLLLNKGASVDAQNSDGWTPLHYAADIGDAALATLLLDLGATYSLRDNDGRTAAQLAVDVGHGHVADAIFEAVEAT